MVQYSWYYPAKNYKNKPDLSKAWAYYEHITLPRQLVRHGHAGHLMRRAEPGEMNCPTKLFPAFTTPNKALIEWGVGIDMYFTSVLILASVLCFAALLHLPNAMFYASTDYSPDGHRDLPLTLKGTAVCTVRELVACTESCRGQWNASHTDKRRYMIANSPNGTETILVYRNACHGGGLKQGLVNWVVLVFLVLLGVLVSIYLKAREVRFDEDK